MPVGVELDLSRICTAPSARLSHLAFEGQGAFPRTAEAIRVVKACSALHCSPLDSLVRFKPQRASPAPSSPAGRFVHAGQHSIKHIDKHRRDRIGQRCSGGLPLRQQRHQQGQMDQSAARHDPKNKTPPV